jgi:hypothetical protein
VFQLSTDFLIGGIAVGRFSEFAYNRVQVTAQLGFDQEHFAKFAAAS